jgi:hypothetical protein
VERADAVAFDDAIRHGSAKANADGHPLRGSYYLHPSRVPLDLVVLRPRAAASTDRAVGRGPAYTPRRPTARPPAPPPS